MDRLYYTYLIIKESLDYIPAIEIKGQLEEKYRIKVDVKTVYHLFVKPGYQSLNQRHCFTVALAIIC